MARELSKAITEVYGHDPCVNDDAINPSHYKQGKYETIDIILDRVSTLPGDQAALVSNVIKYLWRYDNKNGKEDLEKAQWYLKKLAEVVADGEDKI